MKRLFAALELQVGKTWSGAWRAASEPGRVYMGGVEGLTPVRLPAYGGTIDEALQGGHYVTQQHDSVSVEALRWNCSSIDVRDRRSYPRLYELRELVANWPPDTITVPPRHFASLCRFDYRDAADVERAFALRDAELPFLVYNIPEADQTAKDWSTPGFLEARLGTRRFRTERSDDNHFMYFSQGRGLRGWQRPTTDVSMRYDEWLASSRKAYNTTVLEPHFYFRLSPPDVKPSDVPIFKAPERGSRSLFLREPREFKGVHCRFGQAGVIAEAHYDGSRNMVAELGGPPDHPNSGRRRYVLAPPDECDKAYLLPRSHPSGRHSQIDWSRPVNHDKYPLFYHMRVTETILEPGDVLYIPHGWIHYIISLGTNFQCNARSGRNAVGMGALKKCGFL
ncbi:hypothetical protein CTAYLR_007767 [Chrysophaeum taylorii]|uniref:JmjC domain-containing protein n=1 Tax=Chrysophaeum taylorii TaxID=2483200 RepID=A0AAD7UL65_9STRA|nr:hypothetical protein CTAYLR_007767 [Chrysophaeum taylorii]